MFRKTSVVWKMREVSVFYIFWLDLSQMFAKKINIGNKILILYKRNNNFDSSCSLTRWWLVQLLAILQKQIMSPL